MWEFGDKEVVVKVQRKYIGRKDVTWQLTDTQNTTEYPQIWRDIEMPNLLSLMS